MHLSPPRGTEFIDGNAYLTIRQWRHPESPGHPRWERSYKDNKHGISAILMIFATGLLFDWWALIETYTVEE